jgi:hypothetical protein
LKKASRVLFVLVFAFVFVFGLFLVQPQTVEAIPMPPTSFPTVFPTPNPTASVSVFPTGIADGQWEWQGVGINGSEINGALIAAPISPWLQILTNAVKIDGPAKICHPFRGGQFKWIGEIRQLVDGKWVKLATTSSWVPDAEGEFMACAQAPSAGTYALLGYYSGPSEVKPLYCGYDTSQWIFGYGSYDDDPDRELYLAAPTLPANTLVSYQVLWMSPAYVLTGSLTGSGTKYPADHIWAQFVDFVDYPIVINGLHLGR